jgi:hypothetical protein
VTQSVSNTLELFSLLDACYQKVNLLIIKNQAASAEDVESFKAMLRARDQLRGLINAVIENAYKASGEAVGRAISELKPIALEVKESADILKKIADGVILVQKIVSVATAVAEAVAKV